MLNSNAHLAKFLILNSVSSNAFMFFLDEKRDDEPRGGRGGVLPYMGYVDMCRCEGYGFQAVYSRIGYHFSGN